MRPGEEKGRLVRIIAGAGRGQVKRITDNDRTTLTIDGTWDTLPDTNSVFIIEDSAWSEQQDTSPVENSDPTTEIVMNVPVDNFLEEVVLAQVFTVTADGRESLDPHSPFREIYLFGGPGTAQNVDYVTPTFILNETTVGNTKTNLVPIRRNCYAVETTVTLHTPPTADVTIDIRWKAIASGVISSIYPAPIVVPAGGAQWDVLKFTTFVTTPLNFFVDDVLGLDVVAPAGDPSAILTVVVKCHLGTAS